MYFWPSFGKYNTGRGSRNKSVFRITLAFFKPGGTPSWLLLRDIDNCIYDNRRHNEASKWGLENPRTRSQKTLTTASSTAVDAQGRTDGGRHVYWERIRL